LQQYKEGLTADTEDRLNTFILPGVTATGENKIQPNKQFIVLSTI
jgi:hypothetical protein